MDLPAFYFNAKGEVSAALHSPDGGMVVHSWIGGAWVPGNLSEAAWERREITPLEAEAIVSSEAFGKLPGGSSWA